MLKIGIVGGAEAWHARTFSEMFNGYDNEEASKHGFPHYKSKVEGARITHIWDKNKYQAKLLAKICNIENVASNIDELIKVVDGVIIADDITMLHQRKAVPFLKAGLPTMIDKPLSPRIDEAIELVEMAKRFNAPMMSCSALRYAKEIEDLQSKKQEIGEILSGNTICSGDLIFYGIHALEQLYVVVGPGIKSVKNVGENGKDIVIITMKDGRKFVLSVYKDISYLFQMNLYGTKGWLEVRVEDSDYFYSKMLDVYVRMVRTKKEPFQPEETLEIIKALVLAKKTANEEEKTICL